MEEWKIKYLRARLYDSYWEMQMGNDAWAWEIMDEIMEIVFEKQEKKHGKRNKESESCA
jgi:hypothetical protein